MLAGLTLAAALLTAPLPEARPAPPADPGLDALLQEVRRLHGSAGAAAPAPTVPEIVSPAPSPSGPDSSPTAATGAPEAALRVPAPRPGRAPGGEDAGGAGQPGKQSDADAPAEPEAEAASTTIETAPIPGAPVVAGEQAPVPEAPAAPPEPSAAPVPALLSPAPPSAPAPRPRAALADPASPPASPPISPNDAAAANPPDPAPPPAATLGPAPTPTPLAPATMLPPQPRGIGDAASLPPRSDAVPTPPALAPATASLANTGTVVRAAPEPGGAPAEPRQARLAPLQGANAVCRDPRLDGAAIPQILHASWPCGVAQPVRINAISGIALSTPVTLDCNTAGRLASWLTGVADRAAEEHLGQGIGRVWVMGSYACRTRNGIAGGKLSEHARGRAVDIGGFWLDDGTKVTLLDDWGDGRPGRFLAQSRRRACGLFHTVLGPGSDRHHADHLHLDTSPREGDPYCR